MPEKTLSPEKQLASFLAKFTPEESSLAEEILAKMRKRYPTALELVYDNYNALAIGFGPSERASEAIFSIALFPKWISLFFLKGVGLPDPDNKLQGSGNVAKHIRLPSAATLDDPSVQALIREAVAKATPSFNAEGKHRLIIKSISAKQRPRRPAESTPRTPGRKTKKG
jgi:hypothetical protein